MRFNMNNKTLSVIVRGVFFEKFSRAFFISIPNSFSFEAEPCLFRFPAQLYYHFDLSDFCVKILELGGVPK